MERPPALQMHSKQAQGLKQMQHLIMSQQMQQALNFLQLPIMELQPLIEAELEQNPILEQIPEDEVERCDSELPEDQDTSPEKELSFSEHDFEIMQQLDEEFKEHFSESSSPPLRRNSEEEKRKTFLDSLISQQETLFEHLMSQAREVFQTESQLAMAEALIGNFNECGFLATPLEEIALLSNFNPRELAKTLETIQTFEPKGVGARDLREAFLIQLHSQGKEHSLAYRIVESHYDDLLHKRIQQIKKGLAAGEQEIHEAIMRDISKLDLHPGAGWGQQAVPYIIPDVTIVQQNDELVVYVNEDPLPPLRLNPRYLNMLKDETLANETKDFIRRKISSAKWMLRNLTQRNETLVRIAHVLVKKQKKYLSDPQGKLIPMTMTQMAEELELHESTVARAVCNKYVETPRGLLPLRSFFSNAFATEDGSDISSRTVRDEIMDIITKENKAKPLSDESISNLLHDKGIPCARRTVAKYRQGLKVGNALQRKKIGN